MKRKRNHQLSDPCFYCGALVTTKGVGDHFPVPHRYGGSSTVSCCVVCHDMKDRICLENWPPDWINTIVQEFPKLSRETKIFLAKFMGMIQDTDASSRNKQEGTVGV